MPGAFFFVAALASVLLGSAVGGTPCDGVLCTCTGSVARCDVKPEYDLDTYSIDKKIRQLIVRAPVDSMCQALKRKFPRARNYQCDTGANTIAPERFVGSTTDTRHITAAVERVSQKAQSGELTTLPTVTDSHSTSPITTTPATTTASTTVSVTVESLTTPINKPSWMVVKKTPKGDESWCRIKSAHCECDACARKCPCATPPTPAIPEKCTPQIIWISPSPPNATSPVPPSPFTTPTHPTTSAIQTTTTPLPTHPPRPKCDFYEAARTVLGDKERFERLCQTYAPNLYTPSKPAEAVHPATSSVVELTSNAITPTTTATTTTSSAPSIPTDAVNVASVVHIESAKLVQRDVGDGDEVSDGGGYPNPTVGSAYVADEDLMAEVDRLTVTVNQIAEAVQSLAEGVARLEAAVANVEQYLDTWAWRVWDWSSQSGSNLFTFIAAYGIQWLLRFLADRYRRGQRPRQIQMRELSGPSPAQPALPGPAQIPAQVSEHRFVPDSSTLRSTTTGVVYSVPPAAIGAAGPAAVAPPPPPRNDMAVVLKRMDAMSADQQALFDGIADMHQNLMNFTGGDSLVGGGAGPGASGSNRTYQGYNSPGERDRSMRHAYGTAGRGVQRSASGLGQSSSVVPQHRGGAPGTVDARDEFEDMLL